MPRPRAVRVVVLLGPPGSGKSSIGAELDARGLRWRDWESAILARWRTRDAFVAAKAEALPALHTEIRDWVEAAGPVAVIESTGLSDGPLLDRFSSEQISFVVRLELPQEVAMQRVAARPRGRHLTEDVEDNRRVLREFEANVLPFRKADLVIDTSQTSASDAALEIISAVT